MIRKFMNKQLILDTRRENFIEMRGRIEGAAEMAMAMAMAMKKKNDE